MFLIIYHISIYLVYIYIYKEIFFSVNIHLNYIFKQRENSNGILFYTCTLRNRRFRCNAKLYKMGGIYYRYHPLLKSKSIVEHICQSNISTYIKNIVTEKVSLYIYIYIYI